jgi:hypothetical protein
MLMKLYAIPLASAPTVSRRRACCRYFSRRACSCSIACRLGALGTTSSAIGNKLNSPVRYNGQAHRVPTMFRDQTTLRRLFGVPQLTNSERFRSESMRPALAQLGHLRRGHFRCLPRRRARNQAVNRGRGEAMHPVAQSLSIHLGLSGRLRPRSSFQIQGDRPQASGLFGVAALHGNSPKQPRRMFPAGGVDHCADLPPRRRRIAARY